MRTPEPTGYRAIALLALAGFCSSAAFRICDPLLPQLATTFGTSTGAAAYTITVFSVAYGAVQIFWGPIGDCYGKYRTAAFATFIFWNYDLLRNYAPAAGTIAREWLTTVASTRQAPLNV